MQNIKQQKILIGILAFVVVFALGIIWIQKQKQTLPVAHTKVLPDLIVKSFDGQDIRLSSFQSTSTIVLMNAWASWCPYCKDEFADFAKLQKELGERVRIVAINRAEPDETAKSYANALGLEGIQFVLDPSDSFYQAIGGFSMPETVFVDHDGVIRDHRRGPMDFEEMRKRVENLLN